MCGVLPTGIPRSAASPTLMWSHSDSVVADHPHSGEPVQHDSVKIRVAVRVDGVDGFVGAVEGDLPGQEFDLVARQFDHGGIEGSVGDDCEFGARESAIVDRAVRRRAWSESEVSQHLP